MNYEGPKSLKEILSESYRIISPFLTRKEIPHTIAGGIGRIFNEGLEIVTLGDNEPNNRLDSLIGLALKNDRDVHEVIRRRTALYQKCEEVDILRPSVIGEYNHCLDVVIMKLANAINYLGVKSIDPIRLMRSVSPELFTEFVLSMEWPHYFAHEMVHWDFGNTKCQKDLRVLFHAIDFSFDKSKEGKFSYGTEVCESSDYEDDVRTARNEGLEANARLSEHFAKTTRLGLHDFGELTAEIASALIIPPYSGIVTMPVSGKDKFAKKLADQALNEGPTEFIKNTKLKFDESYQTDRNIFEII